MKQPEFSVVVPTRDRPALLTEAVESILAQSIESVEVIVVDDCSAEPASLASDPRIRVVRREKQGGPGAARNSGVAVATGRYLAFCDDDDLYTPDRLEIALDGLRRAPISICWARYLDVPDQRNKGRLLEGNVFHSITDGTTPHLGSTALRREIMLPFREDLANAEDIDWWLRIAQGHPVTTEPRVGYLYRRHQGPRDITGPSQRLADLQRLFRIQAEYFSTHPRAAAFRWKRIGLLAERTGDLQLARRAFIRALRTRPTGADAMHLLRTSLKPRARYLQPDLDRHR